MKKEQILKKSRENPEHILCLFVKDNFKIAKAFWGEGKVKYNWEYHLQQMVLKEDPLKYIEKYL